MPPKLDSKPAAAADDLFGDPAPAAKPAANDAPEAPAAKPAAAPADDLFGDPKPAAEPAKKEPAKAIDDPFGALQPKGQPMRNWTDNTGDFQITGRLVQIADGKVRILKDTGKYTTVPMRRLSNPDLDYVLQVAAQMRSGEGEKLAARQ
jgi:hypothetical protein